MSDIERKLEWPALESVPRRLTPLMREAEVQLEKYYASAHMEDLSKWKAALSRVILSRSFKRASSQFRAGVYYRYGVAHNWTVVLFKKSHNFDEAKKFWSLAVAFSPENSSISLRSRYNIAIVLTLEYRASRELSLLDEAITMLMRCSRQAAPDLPEAALCLEGLSFALERRYRATGASSDLLASVKAAENCVARITSSSSMSLRYRSRLAAVLRMRFELLGNAADLDRAVAIYRNLWSATPKDGVDFLAYMGEASTALRVGYEVKGRIEDLLAAVDIDRLRLERTSPGTNNYEHVLDSYGVSLRTLFEARGQREDIDLAVHCHQLAADALAESHEHFPANTTNLGNALMARYHSYHARNDLDDAIKAYRSSFEQSSLHLGSQHAIRAYNLVSALLGANSDRPGRPLTEEIEALLRTAYEQGAQNQPEIALRTTRIAGRWYQDNRHFREAGQWYSNGLLIAQQLFREQNLRGDKITRIRQIASIPTSAAFCHAKSGRDSDAVLALERGRALLLTESLERKAVELASLKEAEHGDLVQAYQKTSAMLEMAIHSSMGLSE